MHGSSEEALSSPRTARVGLQGSLLFSSLSFPLFSEHSNMQSATSDLTSRSRNAVIQSPSWSLWPRQNFPVIRSSPELGPDGQCPFLSPAHLANHGESWSCSPLRSPPP